MLFVPWQQSIRGEGAVIAFDPFERPQPIQAPIKGRIAERGEGVAENAYVTKGQLLFRIEDQDPLYLSRLEQRVTNAKAELERATGRLETAQALRNINQRTVVYTNDELQSMQTARDEVVAAYDFFVEQADNKLSAARSKVKAWEAKQWQAKADYERKRDAFEDGIESQLKAQESEQKFRDAEANLQIALARSGERQEWLGRQEARTRSQTAGVAGQGE